MSRAATETLALPTEWQVEPIDLDARVVYLPVRHHSPACARNARAVIETARPDAVLIEGPHDAEHLLAFLQHDDTVPPVAIYSTFREASTGQQPHHHASYYPLCSYSPEWVALRSAAAVGARVRLIDLSYAEMIRAGRHTSSAAIESLQEEAWFKRSRFLALAARRAGARDSDDLWDQLFEAEDDASDPARFFTGVLSYCAATRADSDAELLAADGTLAREQHMAACIAEEPGRVVVLTGGFHTVALPRTEPGRPAAVASDAEHAATTLMRYSFEQLDRLNGYAAGMPSPGFYQALWNGRDLETLLVEFARILRAQRGEPSVAESIAAVDHVRGLMQLRRHRLPTREDLLDGIRSVFIKGSADIEGVAVLATARKVLAGDGRGELPPDVGSPPIVRDFERQAAEHQLDLAHAGEREVVLDGYRRARHRRCSQLLHQLQVLQVPFADKVRGPDFVRGTDLDRIQEVWRYQWSPVTEGALIEASRYGGALREATAARLLEQFRKLEDGDQRSEHAAEILLGAARCGLHDQLAGMAARLAGMVAGDPDFVSVTQACTRLLLAHDACEPLELHDDADLLALAEVAWLRAGYLLGQLDAVREEHETETLDALSAWREAAGQLGDDPDAMRTTHIAEVLRPMVHSSTRNPVLVGAACGLQHGDGALDDDGLGAIVAGRLAGAEIDPIDGARFLRGLLHTDRACCWQVEQVLVSLDQVLADCPEAAFLQMCPHLRLAFSTLTPRETDRVARTVSSRAGRPDWRPTRDGSFSEPEARLGRQVERRVREMMAADGLEAWLDD